jgi:hypothetical protein
MTMLNIGLSIGRGEEPRPIFYLRAKTDSWNTNKVYQYLHITIRRNIETILKTNYN